MTNNTKLLLVSALAATLLPNAAALALLRRRSRASKTTDGAKPLGSAPTKPVIYGWFTVDQDCDSSPACLKLETFLRMCNVDFDVKYFSEHQMKKEWAEEDSLAALGQG